MRVIFDDWSAASCSTGIGRYARCLARLVPGIPSHAVLPLTAFGLELSSPLEEDVELPAALARDDVDLFHSPLWSLPAVLPCRAVVTVHDAIPATHPELTAEAFRPVWAQVAEATARSAAVVCPTEHARCAVVRALGLDPSRVHVVPEVPAAVFSPRAPEVVAAALRGLDVDEPYVLVVGSLERRKNPDGVLDALASLAPGARPLALFAGPAAGFDLAAEATRRGLGDRARHLGLVSDETLAALYTGAHGLVFASRAEGFGLPIVEAWACGCPVIASTATCLPEVTGDAALLVDPEDPRAIAAAMQRLLVEGDLRDELRRRGHERLTTHFSPAAVTTALARLYDALEARA